MTQEERLNELLRGLLRERPETRARPLPATPEEAWRLTRALLNVRPPVPADEELVRLQDAYLREEIRRRGITDVRELKPVRDRLYLWKGDITTLRADAVVNAANSRLLGCFVPGHACIDNAIHTFAGLQLRLACRAVMERQGHEEPAGWAKITPAFNLPARFVLHTVGPIVTGRPTGRDRETLAACYRSCLELAEENKAASIAFCCISTGEFRYPNDEAARIAVETVTHSLAASKSGIQVIFNVFKQRDFDLYRELLGGPAEA